MNFSSRHAFVNQFVVGLLMTIGFGGSVGLGTVWMRHQVSVVAEANSALVKQIADVERRIASTRALVEEAQSQDVLVRQNEAMRLGLVDLDPTQLFAVTQDPIQLLVAQSTRRMLDSERRAISTPIRVPLAGTATNSPDGPSTASSSSGIRLPSFAAPGVNRPKMVQFALSD